MFAPCSERQSEFLKSNCTITVYGGSVGSAKSYGGLLRMLRWVGDKDFVGVVVRKNEATLRSAGGLFLEAVEMYKKFEPRIKVTTKPMRVVFPSGAIIDFKGLQDDRDAEKFRGLQLSAILVDEASQIPENHLMMLISRLRTKANMIPNISLTCNPDPDCVIAKWVDWYLYPKGHALEGRPDPSKNGTELWAIRINGNYVFSENKMQLLEDHKASFQHGAVEPISFKFIGATIFDNPPLLKNNPAYLSTLQSLPRVQKERDLYGNWYARSEKTGYFKREWVGELLTTIPLEVKSRVRAWDLAASLPTEQNPDPDFTVGVLLSKTLDDKFVVEDVQRFRKRHGEVLEEVVRIAKQDNDYYGDVQVYIPEDAGQAGKVAAAYAVQQLAANGIGAKLIRVGSTSKLNRFKPLAASAEVGALRVVKAEWNDGFFSELEAFDGTRRRGHDDQVDALSDAFNKLAQNKEMPQFKLEILRR